VKVGVLTIRRVCSGVGGGLAGDFTALGGVAGRSIADVGVTRRVNRVDGVKEVETRLTSFATRSLGKERRQQFTISEKA